VIWALAAILLLAVGFVLLRACDLSILPLYGKAYCLAPKSDALAAERGRRNQLQAELQQAELTFAQKPICAPPPPPPPPGPPPAPEPQPPPEPPRPPEPMRPQEPEKLKAPKNLSELRGCWQSVRGDLQYYSDDEEHRPVGPKARECFCFGGDGHGIFKLLYANGVKCRAPLVARIDGDTLRFHHPRVGCPRAGPVLVPAFVECRNAAGSEAANCLVHNLGRIRDVTTEHYHRVDEDYCQ
jgi:hypothetical protein